MIVGEFLAQLVTEHDTIAKVVVVALHIVMGVVTFMVITRRGWWKPTGPETDWTTTDGCPRCNEHGPYPAYVAGTLTDPEAARERHQAWHELTQALLGPVERCIHRVTQGRNPS